MEIYQDDVMLQIKTICIDIPVLVCTSYLEINQYFHHLLFMHFLKVLVPSHKPDEDLFESTNLFHALGEAKEAYLRLVEVTILEDDASRS